MSKKQRSAKPHRERTSANADSFFIVRGSKSTLLCKHKKPNLITGAEEHVDEIVVELSTEKEKLGIELTPDHINDLVSDCLVAINNRSIRLEYAYSFLTKNYQKDPMSACELIHNIMCNNSHSEVESVYACLETYTNDPQSVIPEDVVGTDEQILYENASTVCKFMRQTRDVISNLHESTESFLLHIAGTTYLKASVDGDYWIDHFLSISYMPCREKTQVVDKSSIDLCDIMLYPYPNQITKERMKQPWRLRISRQTLKTDGYGCIIDDSKKTKSLEINLSNREMVKFLSLICKEAGASIPEFKKYLQD